MYKYKLQTAVCADKSTIHNSIKYLLNYYAIYNGVEIDQAHFNSAQDFLTSKKHFHILYLDVEMFSINQSEEVRKVIQSKNADFVIVLISYRVECFNDAFQTGVFRFVAKPIDQKEMFETLDEVRKQMIGQQDVVIRCQEIDHIFQQKDIVYLTEDKDGTIIYTEQQDFRSPRSLGRWALELDGRLFFPCHRSYIVNLAKIEEVDEDMVLMCTQQKIPVAEKKKTEFYQAFVRYKSR